MLHRIGTWLGRTRKRFRSNERGITTLDWIGLTAAILVFLTAIIFYFQTGGAQAIGARVGAAFNCQIARWEGHGGRCGGAGSPSAGAAYSPSEWTGSLRSFFYRYLDWRYSIHEWLWDLLRRERKPSWALDVPIRNQWWLGDGYACGPASLGMVFDYYHNRDANRQNPTTNEIVNMMKEKGWFEDGRGSNNIEQVNVAKEYGYENSYTDNGWTQDDLRRELKAGHPVIAFVRSGLKTEGGGHGVVVTGISPDGTYVRINDPAQGTRKVSWEQFNRSWSSMDNIVVVVKP